MKTLLFFSVFFLFAFVGIENQDWTMPTQRFFFTGKKEVKQV